MELHKDLQKAKYVRFGRDILRFCKTFDRLSTKAKEPIIAALPERAEIQLTLQSTPEALEAL